MTPTTRIWTEDHLLWVAEWRWEGSAYGPKTISVGRWVEERRERGGGE